MEPPSTLNGSTACPCAATSSGFPFAHMHVHDDDEMMRGYIMGGHTGAARREADSSSFGLSRLARGRKLMSPQ